MPPACALNGSGHAGIQRPERVPIPPQSAKIKPSPPSSLFARGRGNNPDRPPTSVAGRIHQHIIPLSPDDERGRSHQQQRRRPCDGIRPGTMRAVPPATSAPRMATPRQPPVWRAAFNAAAANPERGRSTLARTAVVVAGMATPRPHGISRNGTNICKNPLAASRRSSKTNPSAPIKAPAAVDRKAPSRPTNHPPATFATTYGAVNGKKTRPVCNGE